MLDDELVDALPADAEEAGCIGLRLDRTFGHEVTEPD